MFSSTYATLAEVLKQVRKEKARQFAVVETVDDIGEVVWLYSRPTEFAKI